MSNYEIVLGSVNNRSSKGFPKEGTIKPQHEIEMLPTAGEFYISMFGFDHQIYEWMEFNHTVSGFNGNYFCNYLYFDIDNEDVSLSHATAKQLVTALYEKLNVSPKQLFISFSGNKGFHIGLHQRLFGGFEPSHTLPDLIKVLAVKIVAACFDTTLEAIDKEQKKGSYNSIDLGIYNANRIFRVINSLNAKSNLYKIGLTHQQLFDLDIEQIKDLAIEPQLSYTLPYKVSQLDSNATLIHLLADAKRFDPAAYSKSITKTAQADNGGFFAPPSIGNRNQALFAQACMLFDHTPFTESVVRQLISNANSASDQPLPEDELKKLVYSASKRTAGNTKAEINPVKSIETFYNWFDEWVDYNTSERQKLSAIFTEIDEDNEYNYSGKLACIIGKGGSRKSYYVQNVLAENILQNNVRVIYSTMEMGKVEVVNRLLDIICEPNGDLPASMDLKNMVRKDKKAVQDHIKKAMKQVDANLILSNDSFMECPDYEEIIVKATELYGPVQMLVVDGLSAMGGKGTETEVYSRNTLALKEVAKKHNLFVLLICHTTKMAKSYDRDPKDHVRGSEKILDNCDFTISFSQLIDKYQSEPENLFYHPKYGHLKYYNKRGTGKTINKVFYFNATTKKMIDDAPPIEEFPTYEKFCQEYNAKQKAKAKGDGFEIFN